MLGDKTKWLIVEFLEQREKEREEQRQRWTRTAAIAPAVLGGSLLAGAAAFFAGVKDAATLREATREETGRLRETVRKDAEAATVQLEKARELKRLIAAAGGIMAAAQNLRTAGQEIANEALANENFKGSSLVR